MKRSKIMTIAMVTLVVTLLSACVISGTLARYTTTDANNDEAVVAKFGVVAKIAGGLFNKQYGTDGMPTADTAAGKVIAQSSSGTGDIVAPGTKSSAKGMAIEIAGTPEVSTEIDLKIDASDVTLGKEKFALMRKIYAGGYTESDFAEALKQYPDTAGGLYSLNGDTFTKITAFDKTKAAQPLYGRKNDETTEDTAEYQPVKAKLGSSGSAGTFQKIAEEIIDELKLSDIAKSSQDDYNGIKWTAKKTWAPGHEYAQKTKSITWEWDFSSDSASVSSKKDSVLGWLNSADANGQVGTDGDFVAVETTTGGGDYKKITKTGEIVKLGNDQIARLGTKFDISVTINQANTSGNT